MNTARKKSLWREWGLLIAFGLVLVGLIVGMRFRTDYLADQPVEATYAAHLDALARDSRGAGEIRDRYYREFGRDTVASQDFLGMCRAMQNQARKEGVDGRKYSEYVGQLCWTDPVVNEIIDALPQLDATTGKITYPSEKKSP
jgi:hypothetical protein